MAMELVWHEVTGRIQSGCRDAGLDLVQPFAVSAYNRAVAAEYRLPEFGRANALGVLVGNTRTLWPRFIAALRAAPHRVDDPNPLDAYVGEHVLDVLADVPARCEVRWAYEAPPRRVAMQRLAQVSGMAFLSPTFLCVHPVYGPWFALRAAVVVDADGPAAVAPIASPCSGCETRCVPAFQHALASVGDGPPTPALIAKQSVPWIAVRDSCSAGREHRYTDEQIRYHYTRDRSVLQRLTADGAREGRSDADRE